MWGEEYTEPYEGIGASAEDPLYDEQNYDESAASSDLFQSNLETWQAEATLPDIKLELEEPTQKKKRAFRGVLTLQTKKKVLEELDSGRSRLLICKEYNLPQSSLFEIVKRRDEILFAVSNSLFTPQRKRMRTCRYNDLEMALLDWYKKMKRKKNITITGPDICVQAKQIAARMKIVGFTPNSGWLCRFKQRHGIQNSYRQKVITPIQDVHQPKQEEKKVNPQSKDTWTSKILPEIMKRYSPSDIFTAGETSLFFRCTPDKTPTYLGEDCSCGKLAKDRLTVLVASNMLGTEKLPVFAIGKHKMPRCFKNIKTIPIEYMANSKSFMIPPFFTHWVRKFDQAMVSQGRNIVLFVSPSEAHPRVPDLQAVSLIFLPPDIHFQPAFQGILQTLKQNYRRSIIQRRLHMAEVNGPHEECNITLVDAVHWLRAAWKDVSPEIIHKSFKNAEFSLPHFNSLVPSSSQETSTDGAFQLECDDEFVGNGGQIVMDAEYRRMFESLAKQIVLDPFITAETYASLDDDVVTHGFMAEEELEAAIAKIKANKEDDDNSDDEEEEIKEPPPPTALEAKQCLAKLAKFFATEKGTEKFFDKISRLYHDVSNVSEVKLESNIIDLFSKGAKRGPKKKKSSLPRGPVFDPM